MKKKILLIDDDATSIFIIKLMLKKHDTVGEIITAKNGSEALRLLKIDFENGELPQFIISDIEMPVMDGIKFSKELEKLKLVDYTLTKVVLNSSNPRYKELDWSIESPNVTYFQKPLKYKNLHSILGD